jgi:hypothetical protein
MKITDQAGWDKGYKNNADDAYGRCCFDYARAWAEEMEARMAKGETLAACADAASHDVDRRPGFGITGFMYNMAVSILARCWVHGDELRRWHNLQTQIGDEGERANASGGVLNPALMTVEAKS